LHLKGCVAGLAGAGKAQHDGVGRDEPLGRLDTQTADTDTVLEAMGSRALILAVAAQRPA
jgi:hypothetical protein